VDLFNRLILLAQRQPDVSLYFSYELAPVPSSLFKDNMMRKSDKAALGRLLSQDVVVFDLQNWKTRVVVDGGALLHRVRWQKVSTYSLTADHHVRYVINKYGRNAVVVFDGYCSGPSTKDHEHVHRSARVAAAVAISPDTVVHPNQAAFLANSQNKTAFISFLVKHLKDANVQVMEATGDADTQICSTAIHKAADVETVTVVADDTDVPILLTHHWQTSMADIYMKHEARGKSSEAFISIRKVKLNFGCGVSCRLLVIHAFTGCDTTSGIYSHGKITSLKKLAANSVARWLDDLECATATQEEVGVAGNQLMVALCGGVPGVDSLAKLRYSTYTKLCTYSKTAVRPEQLPPTDRATYFHSLRAHVLVRQ